MSKVVADWDFLLLWPMPHYTFYGAWEGVGKMKHYIQMWKKGLDFHGRTRRREFWPAFFISECSIIFLLFVSGIVSETNSLGILLPFVIFYFVYIIALLIPFLALMVRRLHDSNKSGAWLLLRFVPLIGTILLLVFFCLDSDPEQNGFGPCPKEKDKRED